MLNKLLISIAKLKNQLVSLAYYLLAMLLLPNIKST